MPDEQDIYSIADDFRRDLLADDRDAANALTRAYQDVWQRLQVQVRDLTREMEAARKRGEPVTQSWLLRENRLRSLQQQVEVEIQGLEPRLEGRITSLQQQAIIRAEDAAKQMTMASLGDPPAGAFVQFDRLPRSATVDLVGRLQNGSPLRSLLDELGPDASQRLRSALIRGIATGQGPREIARGMREALGGNLARALTISRTETLRAYREASRRSYEANDDVVEGWIWHAALGWRSCAFCWAQHGSFHKNSEKMATHPNCRCAEVPKTKTWAELGFPTVKDVQPQERAGPDVFREMPKETQLAVLGPSKFKAYDAGLIDLPDLVGGGRSRAWGPIGFEKPLKDVTLRAKPTPPPKPVPARPEAITQTFTIDPKYKDEGTKALELAVKQLGPDAQAWLEANPLRDLKVGPIRGGGMNGAYWEGERRIQVIPASTYKPATWADLNPGVTWSVSDYGKDAVDRSSRTLIHEIGHHVHLTYLHEGGVDVERQRIKDAEVRDAYAAMKKVGEKMGRLPGISQYAMTNHKEYFAESWAAYITNPKILKKHDPIGYAMVERVREVAGIGKGK